MFPLPPASTADLSLAEVLTRLSQHPAIDGLVTIGTTARATLTPISDYDLLVILAEPPTALHVGITSIDHRLTDILFGSTAQVDTVVHTTTKLNGNSWEGRIARWLTDGQIAFDRHGQLHAAQVKVKADDWICPLEAIDSYGAWIGVNYNLLHTQRLFQSDDPIYRAAAELRIVLYGIPSVLYSYFQVRNLYWEGDKAAIRYLQTHDPQYAALLQQVLREAVPERKLAQYQQLAALTLAPISTLWQGEPTVLWSDSIPATFESIDRGLAFWEDLVQHSLPPA